MNTQTITQSIKITSLLSYRLQKAGRYHIGRCPFCGGRDRFTVKHTARGDRWHCRQCGDNRYHDIIDFVMRRDGCSFGTALQILGAGVDIVTIPDNTPTEINFTDTPSAEWQRQAWRHVESASDDLFLDRGQWGREYLKLRGLSKAVAYAWHLGFAYVYDSVSKHNRPAISIPWIGKDGRELTAIKYRFIDEDPAGVRYSFLSGSIQTLFGTWDLMNSDTSLLLVEGEINALSVWQLRPRALSVVSFGSEPDGPDVPESRAVIFRELAQRYKNIVIWMDQGTRSKQYEKVISRPCKKLQSPDMGNIKIDANQLLMMGELPAFVEQVIGAVPMNGEVESMAQKQY